MTQPVDVLGQRFGRYLVIAKSDKRTKAMKQMVLCKCDCGTEREVVVGNLRSGLTTSCGCWKKVSTHANEVPMQKKCNQLFSLVSNQRKANDMLALHWPLSTVAGNLMVLTAEYFVGTETPFVSKKKLEYPNNIYTVWSTA